MKESNNNKVRFAIVGFGHIGKRHAAMILNNPECQLVAVCDDEPWEKGKLKDQQFEFFCSLDEMLEAGLQIDVLCVATPNGLHERHAISGLRAGLHVVIEKPMALTKAGCEKIIFESLHQHRQVFCVMQK